MSCIVSGTTEKQGHRHNCFANGSRRAVKSKKREMLLVSMPCSTPSDGGGAKKKGLPFGGNQSSTFESSGEYRGGGACGGSSSTDGSWHTATGGSGLATNLILDQLPCVLRKFLQVSREIKSP